MGDIFGTPQYHGPGARDLDRRRARADLYALGVIMFEMMTQRLPFEANDPGT
jgi:serine/threonine-protein kinase